MPDPAAADASGPTFDSADYELRWPRPLFVRELRALQAIRRADHRTPRIELLLQEAFLGSTPLHDYRDFAPAFPGSSGDGWPPPDPRDFVEDLLSAAPRLREHRTPRPYWSARHGADPTAPARSWQELRADFTRHVMTLYTDGYLDRALPKICVDDRDGVEIDPSSVLLDRLGLPDLWPLEPDEWAEDTFYDLIEVFHDLVARPRYRWYHDYSGCGWHYSDFATDIGRALYRSRINQLLGSSGLGLRLADDGEDVGRLVRVVDDARTDLLDRTLSTAEPDVRDRVEHAIALYRARDATEHHKRSAAITLAGILEERRDLIRADIGRKDEGALFGLANEFAIRHQRRGQQGDYDPAFLDWIFWWYLATIELTDRILSRQGTAVTDPAPEPATSPSART